ncbi:hypothetical protein BCON_0104g00370 [Botryotinia convoluta]|uniref:Heterokaryon incompatibility domain-containing protein n=1 Tax=Botryotinia convoluta TaxID=54673 RepID=A0A4Z1I732_9HELO|nr:hypothetical protein BCON_0104g00370 [Botryotinia convoluta]
MSVPYKFITRKYCQGLYGLSLRSNYIINDTEFALYGRAWVLQERLLSPRTKHFSEQLIWECREEGASEFFPMGLSLKCYGTGGYNFSKDWRSNLQDCGHQFWVDTLGRYMKSSLTYSSDRLVAIGAIAREHETELDDFYLAGLWKKELPLNLHWKIDGSSSFPSRTNTYRCPTWSWASLDNFYPAMLQISTRRGKALAEVLEAKVSSPPVRAYTEYYAGHIQLRGKLYSIGSKDAHEWLRGDNHEVFLGRSETCWPINSFLDIKIQKYEGPRLYLIPIASEICSGYIECLILRPISMGSIEFERVGVLSFSPNRLGKDPFLGDLDTITIF